MEEERATPSPVGSARKAVQRPERRSDGVESPGPVPASRRRVTAKLIEPLLKRPERIRNVSILAHVDHGKTTLTDSLLASNGIISFKQAGSLRYMDAREDEQERGITMESSAVSLLYDDRKGDEGDRRFLLNLIDCPGHVDFSGQVATASKLSDGCLVLVDAVEGVCTQTGAMLRQAYADRLTPCLVINKLDRLVTELKLTSTEGAEWLFRLLSQVNAVQAGVQGGGDELFCPRLGNVLFASGTDGWAFRLADFTRMHSARLGMKEAVLQETLWGEFYFDSGKKRVLGRAAAERAGISLKPLFASLILDNIWAVYAATSGTLDLERIQKIAAGLSIKLQPRELKAADGRALLRSIMTSWLPLAECAFGAIVDQLPDPSTATLDRLPVLLDQKVEDEIILAYVAKQIAVPSPDGSGDRMFAMARLFHGSLSLGQSVHVLRPGRQPVELPVPGLFLLMGRELEPVQSVYAGCVFAIGSWDLQEDEEVMQHLGRSATISSSAAAPLFDASALQKAAPIVRVALHPDEPAHMEQLLKGLRRLCQADPAAQSILQAETGEHILAAAGELHLEQCLKDLRERYTSEIKIHTGPPMVPFRETITEAAALSDDLWAEGLQEAKGEGRQTDGSIAVCTPNGKLRIAISAAPMSEELAELVATSKQPIASLEHTKGLPSECILAQGPRRLGPNLLVAKSALLPTFKEDPLYSQFLPSILNGFQLATEQGPLCAEPMMGLVFTIHSIETVNWPSGGDEEETCRLATAVKGHLISTSKDACHRAFLSHSPRLLLATYSCDIQCTAEVLGRVYSVLSRRSGTILSEEYNDTTGFFTIHALIPVIESFGFADDIRGRTSGMAFPQLLFHGFKLLDLDPFWVPTTEEELEDYGEPGAERANRAMRYLIRVRERKGLFVEKKIVQFAEKQRTLKK